MIPAYRLIDYSPQGPHDPNFILQMLVVVDSYLKLILTSWPAVILILSLILLYRHGDAISYYIKHRFKSAGLSGIDSFPPDSTPVAASPSSSPSSSTSPSSSPSASPSPSAEDLPHNTPRVSYKIASVLPNSVSFNFLEEHKVWFWIFNYDPDKYLAYIKVKFITDKFEEESKSDYYGGLKAWKLNGYSGIQAPGLGFPEEIKEAVSLGKRINLEINCQIHDEFNNFIEEKLPQTYSYDTEGNYWFLEP